MLLYWLVDGWMSQLRKLQQLSLPASPTSVATTSWQTFLWQLFKNIMSYSLDCKNIFVQIANVFVQIAKYICVNGKSIFFSCLPHFSHHTVLTKKNWCFFPKHFQDFLNCQMYLSQLEYVFVQIGKCMCSNYKIYLFKWQKGGFLLPASPTSAATTSWQTFLWRFFRSKLFSISIFSLFVFCCFISLFNQVGHNCFIGWII